MDTHKTRVKFIMFDGEVLALFPDTAKDCNEGMIMSYQHVGQHGEASASLMHRKRVMDYRITDLFNELIDLGYNLVFNHIHKPIKN